MGQLAGFGVGFVTGWAARSSVDSSREMIVKLVSLGFAAIERVRRLLALERERLDDLVAEGRQRAGLVDHEARAPEGRAGLEDETPLRSGPATGNGANERTAPGESPS